MEIDKARQRKARHYARQKLVFSLLDLVLLLTCLTLTIATGLDKLLRDQLYMAVLWAPILTWHPFPGYYPAQLVAYFAIAFCGYCCLSLPLAYLRYRLSFRYGLALIDGSTWLHDTGKNLLLNFALQAGALLLTYGLLASQPHWWWLWLALLLLLFSIIMTNLAPVLIFPLFYRFKPLPEGELNQRLLELARRTATRVQGIFTIQLSHRTTAATAALMGLGNTRRIVLGDTMTDRYTIDEIEVVLAHEIGHHVHNHIWKMLFSQGVLTLAGLSLTHLFLRWLMDNQNMYFSLTDPATIPLFALLVVSFHVLIMPIRNTLSRHMEYQADEYALQVTQKVDAFKSVMRRLASQNLTEIVPAPLVEFWLYSHPAVHRRLRHADEFAERLLSSSYASASFKSCNRAATSSTGPSGMVNSGSSTPHSAH
ncbi:STE24 endopeptidase [Thermosporothrix hazakensis]|jgi:STE24 endopeptidase|uniref:STE24 endopeptidase n=1 Tax=Thermosporothrix hazakensis TaxID=644383 RepID=A0A326U3N6_THEHA|nr:M48 family metallopeptidase [Thermosporothrix hazakensis]PZW26690.1 STE24 endopeptidase [Thermosporothrix hazakensis]GCE47609.1 hypothetical protein KTH_24780 [Thermosporothrix hazakensis]